MRTQAYFLAVRVRLVAVLAAAGGLTSVPAVEAVAAPGCPKGRICTSVTVPLDRTGAVPGTVRLHVQRAPAARSLQPPLFVLVGGGASSTRQFEPQSAEDWFAGPLDRSRAERSGATKRERVRDVVVVDLRGTGRSGALDCPALQRQGFEGRASTAAACAASLGSRRAFYTTDDSVEDLEAVRAALGAPRIALLGRYYGASVVLAYARRYPGRVERMLLDSPPEAGPMDPLGRTAFQAAPRIFARICARQRCRGITTDLTGDVKRLAAMLERRPVRGRVLDGRGRGRAAEVDAFDLLALAGMSNPFAPAELPGVVRNALRGDLAPLLRAVARRPFRSLEPLSPRAISWAAYAASLCEAPGFPWPPGTPVADRMSRGLTFARSLPAGTFGWFGPSAALGSDVIELCREWPAAGRPPTPSGPLPAVPTLVVTGDELSTPLEVGRQIAKEVPSARVVTTGAYFFDVFGDYDDHSGCRGAVTDAFFAGDESWRTRRWCPEARSRFRPLIPPPVSLRDLAPVGGRANPGRTLAAVRRTVADGYIGMFMESAATLFRDRPKVIRVGALRAGSYRFRRDGTLRLLGASLVPGVRVTGRINWDIDDGRGRGRLRIDGPAASKGRLTLRGGVLSGLLGGRGVRARLGDANLNRLFGDD
jgi:pimeloyl-ACP methyl ester carboxylesterase